MYAEASIEFVKHRETSRFLLVQKNQIFYRMGTTASEG